MNKLLVGLALLALLGAIGTYTGWKRPLPSPQTVTKTEYIDRVKTETIVRTITKKDGTVIQETIGSKSETKETSKVVTKAPLSRWSLGINATAPLERLIDPNPIYGVQVGRRLLDTPIWLQAGFTTKRELTLGFSFEF